MGVVRQIQAFNAGRDPERLQMKYRAMRASTFAFQRSTCHLFYDRLPRGGLFKSAPLVWVCGDLHIENFGSYRGDNGLVYFDINDFDEAALAPTPWELARLLASVWIGADTLQLARRATLSACHALIDAYADALAMGKAFWVERETARGPIRSLLDGLHQRTRAQFLDARTVGKGEVIARRPCPPRQPRVEPAIGLVERGFCCRTCLSHIRRITPALPRGEHNLLRHIHCVIIENPVEHPHLARGIASIRNQAGRDMFDDNARFHDRYAVVDEQREFADRPVREERRLVFGMRVASDIAEFEPRIGFIQRDQRLPCVGRERMAVEDHHFGFLRASRPPRTASGTIQAKNSR